MSEVVHLPNDSMVNVVGYVVFAPTPFQFSTEWVHASLSSQLHSNQDVQALSIVVGLIIDLKHSSLSFGASVAHFPHLWTSILQLLSDAMETSWYQIRFAKVQTNQKCPICHRMIEENEESSVFCKVFLSLQTNEIIIRALTEKCMSPELRAKFQTIFFGEGESIHKAYSGFIHSFLYIPTSVWICRRVDKQEIKPILDQIEELLKLKIYESRPCLLFGCSFGSMQQFHELCDLFQNPALNDGVYWSVFLQPITDQDVSTMDLGKGFIQDLLSIDRRKLLCINSIVFIWRKYPNFKLQRVTDAISNMDDEVGMIQSCEIEIRVLQNKGDQQSNECWT